MKTINKILTTFVISSLSVTSAYSITKLSTIDQKNPDVLVQTTINNTFDILKSYKGNLSSSNTALKNSIKSDVLPLFNTKYIGARVLGQQYKTATTEQLSKFNEAIENYMLNAYIDGLGFYNGQEVKFGQTRLNGNNFATTGVTVVDKKPISIEFKLIKNSSGEYKIIDFTAEGISITQTKLVEWQPILLQKGVDGLTKYISENSTNILDKYKNIVK